MEGVPLLTVRGITIEAHWTWVPSAAFLYNAFANYYFPNQLAGIGTVDSMLLGAVATCMFFTSIVLHELGHSFQGRREGRKVHRITLFFFGGVAWIEGRGDPAPEARITAAGPLVSLLLAAGFGLAATTAAVGLSDHIVVLLRVMALVNLILLLFNLLPIYPLDGGRLLQEALWYLRNDFYSATRIALRTNTVGVVLLVGMGSLSIATGWIPPFVLLLRPRDMTYASSFYLGAQFIVMGLVLRRAASMEKEVLDAHEDWWTHQASPELARARAAHDQMKRRRSNSLQVRDLLLPAQVDASPDVTAGDFLDQLSRARGYATVPYPVLEGGVVVGLVCHALAAQIPVEQRATTSLRDVMMSKEQAVPLSPDTPLRTAFTALYRGGGRGVVLETGADGEQMVVGIVLLADVAEALEEMQTGVPPR